MSKTIKIGTLPRVEGEGGIYIKIGPNGVDEVRVNIFEPPRFFESILRGRLYHDAPDITARICGICPVAYQMASIHALERILDINIDEGIRRLRRLFHLSEWISSHSLHVYFLNAPDFFGLESALSFKPDMLREALELKSLGNELFSLLGGRPIHPISACVGGFYRVPKKEALLKLLPNLKMAYEKALRKIQWASTLEFPALDMDIEFLSISHPDEYPVNEGRVLSDKGLDIDIDGFKSHIEQYQVPHSTALHTRIKGRGNYLVGPLSRVNLNHKKLPPEIISEIKIPLPITNIFMSILARVVEIAYALYESIKIIEEYEEPLTPKLRYNIKEGTGAWITEAPRGSLYHIYKISDKGYIEYVDIVPPTAQNLSTMEKALRTYVEANIKSPISMLKKRCEMLIRCFDPCISCSTHYIDISFKKDTT